MMGVLQGTTVGYKIFNPVSFLFNGFESPLISLYLALLSMSNS